MKKITILIAIFIILLSGCGSSDNNNSDKQNTAANTNIKELSFLKTDDITLEVGESKSSSYVKVSVKDRDKFSPDDVLFISDNPDVATIRFTKDALTTTLYYEITAIGAGETEVYAKAKDGEVESEHIRVIVPQPIEVESITLVGIKTKLVLGESCQLSCDVSPSKAADKTINWKSSDESVVKINSKGEVTVIGGGTATITASTNNGISKSFDLTVDATKRKMKLSVTRKRLDDVNIGDDWSFENKVSGAKAQTSLIVSVGEELTLYSKYTESDENPDIGEASTTHTITEADFNSGFEVTMDVYVTENGGQNRGKSAHFVVTYKFTP